jgi:DNA-binding CsgD family transcriptional regulator
MASLSEKDMELLSWAADGMTADEIAERMGCSPNTIKSRKSRIFRKLNVTSMSQAIYKSVHQIADWRRSNGREDATVDSGLGFTRMV